MDLFARFKVPFVLFFTGSIITLMIFQHRIQGFASHMPLPDVDFEGTMWVSWYFAFLQSKNLSPLLSDYFSFPYTLDYSEFIVGNLTTDLIQLLLQLIGPDLLNTILITNIISFLTFPFSIFTSYFLARIIGCSVPFSFLASLAYTFSYNHIMDGRGIMVLGQYWLIPLSLAYTIKLCREPTFKNTMFLGFTLGLQLGFDGYYGFYSIAASFFTAVALLGHHFQKNFIHSLKRGGYYFTFIMFIISTMNLQFISANICFLLFKSERESISREIPFTEHLQPLENFFFPSYISVQSEFFRALGISQFSGGSILSYTLFILAILGLFFFKKFKDDNKKLYILSFVGILCVLSVATDWKYGTPLRKFYFDHFGVFRSVGRLHHYYTLFLTTMASVSLSELCLQKPHFLHKASIQYILVVILGFFIITEGLNYDFSWKRQVDLRKAHSLFLPLRNDPEIKRVISLPNVYKDYNMIPAQQIAQMVHNKHIFVSTSPSSLFKHQFRKEEGLNPGVLDRIIKMGIDTIVIYNYYHHNQYPIHPHEMLVVDPRVTFKGHYKQSTLTTSHLERSFDISVYKIKPHAQLPHSFDARAQFKNTGFATQPLQIKDNIATLNFPHTANVRLFSKFRPWEIFIDSYQPNTPTRDYDFSMSWNIPSTNPSQFSVVHPPTLIRFIAMWASRFITLFIIYTMISSTRTPLLRFFEKHLSH